MCTAALTLCRVFGGDVKQDFQLRDDAAALTYLALTSAPFPSLHTFPCSGRSRRSRCHSDALGCGCELRAAFQPIGCRLFPGPTACSFHLNVNGERRVGGDKSSDRGATWRRRVEGGGCRVEGGGGGCTGASTCVWHRRGLSESRNDWQGSDARCHFPPKSQVAASRLKLSHSDSVGNPTMTWLHCRSALCTRPRSRKRSLDGNRRDCFFSIFASSKHAVAAGVDSYQLQLCYTYTAPPALCDV